MLLAALHHGDEGLEPRRGRRLAVIFTSGASPVSSTGRRSPRARHQIADAGDGGRAEDEVDVGGAPEDARCWSWAMHPITPMTRSGTLRLSARSSPSFEKTLSSAFSRIAQVLTRMRSAVARPSVSS